MANNVLTTTTVANAVLTVTFPTWLNNIEVLNSGNDVLWLRTDQVDPVIAGPECTVVPAQTWKDGITNNKAGATNTQIRFISATAVTFTVEAR